MTNLPTLQDEPTRYAGCCLSLSNPLLATISSLLTSTHAAAADERSHDEHAPERGPALILSIGSGTGLFEELLHTHLNNPIRLDASPPPPNHAGTSRWRRSWRVEGVEVHPAVNAHLPADRMSHVPGTWAVHAARARDAAALMFVYPRDGALVRRYVNMFMSESRNESWAADERAEDDENKARDEGGDQGSSSRSKGVRLVLWLGPKCDWEDTGLGSCDAGDGLEMMEIRDGAGLAEYEMLAVLRRKATASVEGP
ncbi:hypothetical protein F4825DRAFT_111438 [Nemania diffusa]|nr:hypothetical protein F4825DRAFT_111438 [Nemania diffusa]